MRKIDKVEMGIMYLEMAEINLTLAQHCFHSENEGEYLGYGQMDRTEGESKAE